MFEPSNNKRRAMLCMSFPLSFPPSDRIDYVWCLISDGSDEIVVSDDGVWGREAGDDEEEWQAHLRHLATYKKNPRRIWAIGGPRRGTRMVHAMSDRSE